MKFKNRNLSKQGEGNTKQKNTFVFLGIFAGIIFLFMVVNVNATSVTLVSPEDGTNFAELADINFICNLSAETGLNKLELLSDINRESSFQILKTFNKGSFNETTIGNNLSTNYLNEMNVTSNPTYIIDNSGQTCGTSQDPCNLFNTSTGDSVVGGYWVATGVANSKFTMTLNDTFLISKFQLLSHGTFYSNYSALEYSLDNVDWNIAFNKSTTNSIVETFSTPFYAKYLRFSSISLNNGLNLYGIYVNVTGQILNTSTPYNGSLNYTYSRLGGGDYNWNCKAYTNSENITAVSNYTFVMDGTRIDWVSPTPASGTESTHITVKTEVASDNNAYGFFSRDNSLIGWWTFDSTSNRLQSVNNQWGGAFTESGTPTYISTDFGQGVSLGDADSITADNVLTGNNDEGFTLGWSMNISNATAFDVFKDLIYNSDYVTGGFKLRFFNYNSTHFKIDILMYNSTNYSNIAPLLTFPKSYITDFKRYVISADIVNQEYNLYIDGELVSTDTTSASFNFYDHGNDLTFSGASYFDALVDDIIFFNASVTDNEGKILSNYSNINNLAMDYSTDKNVTMKPYGYDTEGTVTTSDTRTFNFLTSPIIEYTHLFNDNNQTLWGYCRATFSTTPTEDISHVIQYSLDNETWIDLTETYHENNETYAIIGDSMSNAYSDWPGYLTDDLNISDTAVLIYAVSGNTCTQTYDQLINNVTNGTTNLFSTCGVNGAIPTTNTDYWEDIYLQAKAKNISKIYMTTMPPWDVINTYDDVTAQQMCDLQKSQNEWLISFSSDKDDLEVVDVWSFYHDTSGTNKTDCGWRTDISYSNDGIHPNNLGMEYWGDEYWKLFNEWSNNTFETSLVPIQRANYYFRCYTEGERISLVSSMGTLDLTDTTASVGQDTGRSSYNPSFWTNTYREDYIDFVRLRFVVKQMKKGERIQIKIDNETHHIGIVDMGYDSVTVNVSSEPQQAILKVGDIAKFEITNDSYYDLKVIAKEIDLAKNTVNLSVSYIHEEIPTQQPNNTSEDTDKSIQCGIGEGKNLGVCINKLVKEPFYLLVATILVVIILVLSRKRKRRKK